MCPRISSTVSTYSCLPKRDCRLTPTDGLLTATDGSLTAADALLTATDECTIRSNTCCGSSAIISTVSPFITIRYCGAKKYRSGNSSPSGFWDDSFSTSFLRSYPKKPVIQPGL